MKGFCDISSLYQNGYSIDENEPLDAIKQIIGSGGSEGGFYHLNINDLVERVEQWRSLLPRVVPHYAVKCNNHPAVLRTFDLLGLGFDCASKTEMQQVLSLGVEPQRVVYAHPCKVASHIEFAKKKGVRRMTFDSSAELHKVAKRHPGAQLLIRIRCDATAAQCPLGVKYGVMPDDARPLLALAAKLGLGVAGVAFHVGSGCQEPQVFLRAIKEAKRIFLEAEEEGHEPSILDIGGGFFGGEQMNLAETAGYINEALEEHFPEGCGVDIIAEPGRYMVQSAFTLATSVINRRDDQEAMIFIDDGLYGSFNALIYDHQKLIPPLPIQGSTGAEFAEEDASQAIRGTIWGPTCDSFDKVLEGAVVPSCLRTGDWLVWRDMGAYTLAAGCSFNGFPLPTVMSFMSLANEMLLQESFEMRKTESDSLNSSGCVSEEEESTSSPTDVVRRRVKKMKAADDCMALKKRMAKLTVWLDAVDTV